MQELPPVAIADEELDTDFDSEDDVSSVAGGEFDLREGETEQERKIRISKHLREREKRRRDAKRNEGTDGKKNNNAIGAGGNKNTPRVKPAAGKNK